MRTIVNSPDHTLQSSLPWRYASDQAILHGPVLCSSHSNTAGTLPFTTISSISSGRIARRKDQGKPLERINQPFRKFISKLRHLDPVKLAYLRTSFVFAFSVLVTWTPSSINRVYTLANPYGTNYGLNLASAVVLPLQGSGTRSSTALPAGSS